VLALVGLFLIPTTIYRSLALAPSSVVVAVAAMLTLIPALLALLGDKVDWPRKRNYDDPARIARQAQLDAETIHGGFWGRITKAVMARPVVALVLSVGLLVALAVPALDLKTGFAGVETLPPSDVRSGFDVPGLAGGLRHRRPEPADQHRDGRHAGRHRGRPRQAGRRLRRGPCHYAVVEAPRWSPSHDFAVVDLYLRTDANSQATRDTIADLRSDVIPAAFTGLPTAVYVTGEPAFNVDFYAVVDQYTPWVFAFVLALSFLLLTLAFRSVVVPAKAI
jgi:RND superfamily putative drug exporter